MSGNVANWSLGFTLFVSAIVLGLAGWGLALAAWFLTADADSGSDSPDPDQVSARNWTTQELWSATGLRDADGRNLLAPTDANHLQLGHPATQTLRTVDLPTQNQPSPDTAPLLLDPLTAELESGQPLLPPDLQGAYFMIVSAGGNGLFASADGVQFVDVTPLIDGQYTQVRWFYQGFAATVASGTNDLWFSAQGRYWVGRAFNNWLTVTRLVGQTSGQYLVFTGDGNATLDFTAVHATTRTRNTNGASGVDQLASQLGTGANLLMGKRAGVDQVFVSNQDLDGTNDSPTFRPSTAVYVFVAGQPGDDRLLYVDDANDRQLILGSDITPDDPVTWTLQPNLAPFPVRFAASLSRGRFALFAANSQYALFDATTGDVSAAYTLPFTVSLVAVKVARGQLWVLATDRYARTSGGVANAAPWTWTTQFPQGTMWSGATDMAFWGVGDA